MRQGAEIVILSPKTKKREEQKVGEEVDSGKQENASFCKIGKKCIILMKQGLLEPLLWKIPL